LALEMVAHSLCADQVQALRVEFQAMDRNHEGVLCLQDFLDALQAAQRQGLCNGVNLVAAFNALAVERSRGGPQGLSLGTDGQHGMDTSATVGGMTYHEFIAAAMIHRIDLTEERVALAFHALDFERAGHLSADGVRMALGDDLPQATVETMLSTALEAARRRGEIPPSPPRTPSSPPEPLPSLFLQQFVGNFRAAYLNSPTLPPHPPGGGSGGKKKPNMPRNGSGRFLHADGGGAMDVDS